MDEKKGSFVGCLFLRVKHFRGHPKLQYAMKLVLRTTIAVLNIHKNKAKQKTIRNRNKEFFVDLGFVEGKDSKIS